jgi:hypothetical protein
MMIHDPGFYLDYITPLDRSEHPLICNVDGSAIQENCSQQLSSMVQAIRQESMLARLFGPSRTPSWDASAKRADSKNPNVQGC